MNSISKAFTHQNLTLHLIHGPDPVDGSRSMPLGVALKTGSARVQETGEDAGRHRMPLQDQRRPQLG
jgi:hypothetical protein